MKKVKIPPYIYAMFITYIVFACIGCAVVLNKQKTTHAAPPVEPEKEKTVYPNILESMPEIGESTSIEQLEAIVDKEVIAQEKQFKKS